MWHVRRTRGGVLDVKWTGAGLLSNLYTETIGGLNL